MVRDSFFKWRNDFQTCWSSKKVKTASWYPDSSPKNDEQKSLFQKESSSSPSIHSSFSLTLSLFHQIPLAPSKRILITTFHSCGSEYYTSYVVSQETCERKFFQKKPEGLFEREFSFSLLSLPFFKHLKLFWKSVKKVIYYFFRSKIYFQ